MKKTCVHGNVVSCAFDTVPPTCFPVKHRTGCDCQYCDPQQLSRKAMPVVPVNPELQRLLNNIPPKAIFPSGASSRKKALSLDMVPHQLDEFAARRFQYGVDKGHARDNWRGGKDDPEFIRDRINHAKAHLDRVVDGSGSLSDLQAAICNLAMMSWWYENGTGLKAVAPHLYPADATPVMGLEGQKLQKNALDRPFPAPHGPQTQNRPSS